MIVPRYYENLSVLHENTMPARAYYIPASKRMDNLVEHREESDRMQLLNGTWKFSILTASMTFRILSLRRIMIQKILMRFRFQVYGRWLDMIHTSIQTSGIHFRLIHHMCHRTFRVEPMYILLSTVEMRKSIKSFFEL